MPAYDYVCRDCGAKFEVRMSMAAYGQGATPECEECGSARVERAFTAVSVLTGSRSGSSGGGAGCSGRRGGFT